MKLKVIIPMVAAILLGSFCGKFVFQQYEKNESVFQDAGIVYFLQQGVYTSTDSVAQNTDELSDFLTTTEDGKYYVYVGITSKEENANKVKEAYQKENIELYIKPVVVSNKEFLNNLEQYDILLSACNTLDEMNAVLKTVVASYQESVLNQS